MGTLTLDMRLRWTRRTVALALLAVLGSFMVAAARPAGASALGELTQMGFPSTGCLWAKPLGLCATGFSVDTPDQAAVTPDGKFVYVTGAGADTQASVVVLARNTTTGAVRQVSCIGDAGSGCTPATLGIAGAIALSPDAKFVYVGTPGGVRSFARNPTTGALSPASCIGTSSGCTFAAHLAGVSGLQVSKDAKTVIAVTNTGHVFVLNRDTRSGALQFNRCFSDNGDNCTPAHGIDGTNAAAISPDGKSVYVTNTLGGLAIFRRNPTNLAVSQDPGPGGCVVTGAVDDCAEAGPDLTNALGVVIAPDAKSVYVSAPTDASVVRFARNTTTGALTRGRCVSSTLVDDCTYVPGLTDAYAMAMSKDGKSLYVAGTDDDAVVNLARDSTGELLRRDCVATTLVDCDRAVGFDHVYGLAVSPDGKTVYAVSLASDSIATFARTTTTVHLGHLTQLDRPPVGCFTTTGYAATPFSGTAGFCTAVPSMDGVQAMVATKDGKSVYVATSGDNGVHEFRRNTTTGRLSVGGCLRVTADADCGSALGLGDSLVYMAATPDNKSLIVSNPLQSELAMVKRNTTTGALSSAGCLAPEPVDGCQVTALLDHPSQIAVSPDSKSVYVWMAGYNGLALFQRNPNTGLLTPAGCLSGHSSGTPCQDGTYLQDVYSLAVSPDGKNVYVGTDQNVLVFKRATTTGYLTYVGCLGGNDGCGPARAITFPHSIAISADNASVYVTSNVSTNTGDHSGVAVFRRNTTTGMLSQDPGPAGCFTIDGSDGCTTGRGLGGAVAVAVSPDKKSVYVGGISGAIAVFSRSTLTATLGRLTQLSGVGGCIEEFKQPVPEGCTPGLNISNMAHGALAVTAKNVYSASYLGVSAFFRKSS